MADDETPRRLTEAEQQARRRRSIAIALVLVGLAVLFYFVTMVRLGGSVGMRKI